MWFRHSRAQASVTKAREDVLAMFVADNEIATASHPGVGAFQRRGGLMRGFFLAMTMLVSCVGCAPNPSTNYRALAPVARADESPAPATSLGPSGANQTEASV